MKKERKDKHFIKKPVYEGGPGAMSKFIGKNLKYPDEARKQRVEGTVVVRIEIDYKGNVVSTEVLTGIGHGCDEEAERVCRMLKFELERQRNVRVRFHKRINVHFRLPAGQRIQYQYTTSSSEKQSSSVSYSIPFPGRSEEPGGS